MADKKKMGEIIQLIIGHHHFTSTDVELNGKAMQIFALDSNGEVWQATLRNDGTYGEWEPAMRK